MQNTYATFADPAMAEKAAGALLDHGVRAADLSIVFPEGYKTAEHGKTVTGEKLESAAEHGISTTTAGDAGSGAAKGAGIGLVAGTLAALAAVFVPGVGLVLGGGALAMAIGAAAGTTVAGAVAGGVTGYLKDQGVPEQAIEHYEKVIATGGAIVTVSLTDEKIGNAEIESVLAKYNGTVSSYPLSQTAVVTTREDAVRTTEVIR